MHQTVNSLLKLKGNGMHAESGRNIYFATIEFSSGLLEQSSLLLVYTWFCGAAARTNPHQNLTAMK